MSLLKHLVQQHSLKARRELPWRWRRCVRAWRSCARASQRCQDTSVWYRRLLDPFRSGWSFSVCAHGELPAKYQRCAAWPRRRYPNRETPGRGDLPDPSVPQRYTPERCCCLQRLGIFHYLREISFALRTDPSNWPCEMKAPTMTLGLPFHLECVFARVTAVIAFSFLYQFR